jgi:type I restriction enzyme, S subunit
MKNWLTSRVGALLDVQNGFAFKSELFNDSGKGLPIIRIRDLSRGYSETFYDGEHDPSFEVFDNDLLIGMDGEFRCYRWHGGKALLNQRVCRLQKFNKSLHPQFLFYGINDYLREIEANTAFVTVKHLSSKQIANLEIPLPPLPEQARIVKLLDEADALRKLRAQADTRTAELIPALFYEMFGVPFATTLPYPVRKLSELIREGDRVNYGVVQPGDEVPGGIPVVRVGDFKGMSIDRQRVKRIAATIEASYSRSRLQGDEILVSCVGSIGSVALADPSLQGFNIVRAVARVPLNQEVDRVFVASQLMTPELQNYFRQETRTVAQPTLNIRQIQEAPIILPPLPLQKEFAARVTELRSLETAQTASRTRLEELFQSMLHKAFRGEL